MPLYKTTFRSELTEVRSYILQLGNKPASSITTQHVRIGKEFHNVRVVSFCLRWRMLDDAGVTEEKDRKIAL